MTKDEKEMKLEEGLMKLLYYSNEYFTKVDAGHPEHETIIIQKLMKKQTKYLVDLLEGKKDNIIQFPSIKY